MPTSNAIIGFGTKVEVLLSSTWTELGEVHNVTPPNESVDQVDVTHMQSPNRTREFIQGLIDPGDMTVEMNHIPSSATDAYLIAWRSAGDKRSVRITYPNLVTDTFPAFILGYSPTMGVADKMSAQLKLKVAGAITRA